MKIRSDFVSNSSSSSFLVSNSQGHAQLLCQKFAEVVPKNDADGSLWRYNEDIRVSIYCRNKDFEAIWEFFKKNKLDFGSCPYKPYYKDYQTGRDVVRDPDEECWDPIEINLDDLWLLASDSTITSKILEFDFSTADDNNEQENAELAMLYRFFDALGCDPDASVSERSFLTKSLSDFEEVMQKFISKHNHKGR